MSSIPVHSNVPCSAPYCTSNLECNHPPGMGTSSMPMSLLLTLEPEAAVLAVAAEQQERPAPGATPAGVLESDAGMRLRGAEGTSSPPAASPNSGGGSSAKDATRLSAEDVVLVLDCGGGTVDLTLARVYGTGRRTRLEEEAVGRGGQGPQGCLGVWLGMLALCTSALSHITHVLMPSFAPTQDCWPAPASWTRLPSRCSARWWGSGRGTRGGAAARTRGRSWKRGGLCRTCRAGHWDRRVHCKGTHVCRRKGCGVTVDV